MRNSPGIRVVSKYYIQFKCFQVCIYFHDSIHENCLHIASRALDIIIIAVFLTITVN